MKPKTKQMLDLMIAQPKLSNTEAYLRTHKTTNRNSARASAAETLARPSAQIYLNKHIQMAKEKIVDLSQNAAKEDVQFKASESILDRALGKPIQRQITDNKHRIEISLGGGE